jgi:hypothetical protein
MKKIAYIKDNIIKTADKIVVKTETSVIFNPTHEQLLENGWIVYEQPEAPGLSEEEHLKKVRERVLRNIEKYDSSPEVNLCYITYMNHTMPYWASKSERNDLKTAIEDCFKLGRAEYRLDLRDLGIVLTVGCEDLLNMLSALEVYAVDCFNRTTDHIYAVKALTTIDEVFNYNYRVGYPEKLTFYF